MGKERKLRIMESFKKLRSNGAVRSKNVSKFVSRFSAVSKTILLVLFYYTFSIGLTFYNKKLIKYYKLPLSITLLHLLFKYIAATWVRSLLECRTGTERVILSWREYLKRVALAGTLSGLDIALSNWSFEFITVSLYTMTKSSSVIFILLFSLCLKLEKFTWSLMAVVAFISTGLFMFTYQSTQFEWHGFVMVFTAAVLSGLRWTLTQLVLQKQELGLSHPIDMMYHMQPWMLVGLLPLAVGTEGIHVATSKFAFGYHDMTVAATTLGLSLLGAAQAFCLEISEFLLLYHTSSLTLAVSGIIKELCTLYIAYEFNGDRMTTLNAVGLVVCLSGIALHAISKYRHSSKLAAQTPEYKQRDNIELLLTNGDANVSESDEEDDVEIFNSTSFVRR